MKRKKGYYFKERLSVLKGYSRLAGGYNRKQFQKYSKYSKTENYSIEEIRMNSDENMIKIYEQVRKNWIL